MGRQWDILNADKDHKKLSVKELPIEFVPKSLRRYYFKRTRIDGTYKRVFMWNRFVFSVYLKLKESLEAGEVYIKDSINYRCLENELIPKTIWNKDKKKLVRNLGNNLLLMNIEDILDKLRDDLNKLEFWIRNSELASNLRSSIVFYCKNANKN